MSAARLETRRNHTDERTGTYDILRSDNVSQHPLRTRRESPTVAEFFQPDHFGDILGHVRSKFAIAIGQSVKGQLLQFREKD